MKRKRFIKLLMSCGLPRNAAVRTAEATRQFSEYNVMYLLLKDLLIDATAKYILVRRPLETEDFLFQIKNAVQVQKIIEASDRRAKEIFIKQTDELIKEGVLMLDEYEIFHRCEYVKPVELGSVQYTLDLPYYPHNW